MSTADELERMYRFFYLCPVGLIEVDGAGAVQHVNPAAVRMLTPVHGDAPAQDLVSVLDRLAPGVRALVGSRPEQQLPAAGAPGLLLRDLRSLFVHASGVHADWEMVAQVAQGIRDTDLLGRRVSSSRRSPAAPARS